MNRRAFLKAVFAVAVAPASVVEVLYHPKAGLSERDIADLVTATLNDLPRNHLQTLFEDYGRAIEEFNKALFQPPKTSAYCAKPNVGDHFYDMFKAGIIKTKPDFVYEGPVNFICKNRRANMIINHPKGEPNENLLETHTI